MADIFSKQKRSEVMSRISGKNTKPEMIVRRCLHRSGFRFRLHDKRLPGKPDLVLKKYEAVIFINGCFWHGHSCHLFKWPKTRVDFWKSKIESNQARDQRTLNALYDMGWRALVVFECALKGKSRLSNEDLISQISSWLLDGPPMLIVEGG